MWGVQSDSYCYLLRPWDPVVGTTASCPRVSRLSESCRWQRGCRFWERSPLWSSPSGSRTTRTRCVHVERNLRSLKLMVPRCCRLVLLVQSPLALRSLFLLCFRHEDDLPKQRAVPSCVVLGSLPRESFFQTHRSRLWPLSIRLYVPLGCADVLGLSWTGKVSA